MRRKSVRGVTLVELLLAMALLAVITVTIGAAMVSASRAYAVSVRMQEDELNARLALLAITRELHRGVSEASASQTANGYELIIKHRNETDSIVFRFRDGLLTRLGESPISFVPVRLRSFSANSGTNGMRLTIRVECMNSMVLETVAALLRVPAEGG